MKRVNLSDSVEKGVDVNMSPLIDCVFLLLIFFIVTTVFVEETGVEVNKPEAASAVDLEKNSVMLAIRADGSIVFGGQEVGLNSVRGVVARQLTSPDMPVILITDGAVPTSRLVDVMDECKRAGAKTVSVAAERE
jgi:biopolymer transport protein ExbD